MEKIKKQQYTAGRSKRLARSMGYDTNNIITKYLFANYRQRKEKRVKSIATVNVPIKFNNYYYYEE